MKKLLALFVACIFTLSLTDSTQDPEINVWRKISSDEMNPGLIIALDMTKGYAFSDYQSIYIIVQPLNSEDQIVLAFPNGGYWSAPEADPFKQELQKEFDSLEDYLRNLESNEIKKK